MITTDNFTLPAGITLKDYKDDLLMIGTDINSGRYQEIKEVLPEEFGRRLMGWKNIGKAPAA